MGHASLPWCPLCCQRGLSPIPHDVAGSLARSSLGRHWFTPPAFSTGTQSLTRSPAARRCRRGISSVELNTPLVAKASD